MYRVNTSNTITDEFNFNDYQKYYTTHDEMRDWCRTTFGKGYDKKAKSWLWKSRITVATDIPCHHWAERTVFYFAKEEHATWFLLKWP